MYLDRDCAKKRVEYSVLYQVLNHWTVQLNSCLSAKYKNPIYAFPDLERYTFAHVISVSHAEPKDLKLPVWWFYKSQWRNFSLWLSKMKTNNHSCIVIHWPCRYQKDHSKHCKSQVEGLLSLLSKLLDGTAAIVHICLWGKSQSPHDDKTLNLVHVRDIFECREK